MNYDLIPEPGVLVILLEKHILKDYHLIKLMCSFNLIVIIGISYY